jgi:hypothetical protein
MIDGICIEECSDSYVKFVDGRRFVTVDNTEREVLAKIRVDGCAIKNGMRADWVVEKEGRAIIIELKGRDIEHAIKQVFATAEFWKSEKRCQYFAALIVGRQFPRASASIQLKQQRFARVYKAPLHIVTHDPTVRFDHVLSFKGPFKQ